MPLDLAIKTRTRKRYAAQWGFSYEFFITKLLNEHTIDASAPRGGIKNDHVRVCIIVLSTWRK